MSYSRINDFIQFYNVPESTLPFLQSFVFVLRFYVFSISYHQNYLRNHAIIIDDVEDVYVIWATSTEINGCKAMVSIMEARLYGQGDVLKGVLISINPSPG